MASCTSGGESRAECEKTEAAVYPALEELAEMALPEVDYELQRWSHCAEDDGGVAHPTVTVILEEGQSKREARDLLNAAGWTAMNDNDWVFSNGDYFASISRVTPPPRTEVTFRPPSP
jgi:hypothetical protein